MHKYHHKNTSLLAYSLDETSCQRACLASGPFRRQEEWAHLFLPHTVQICHVESSREVRPGFNTLLPMSRGCGQGADVYSLLALQKSSKLTSHAQQLHPSHCQTMIPWYTVQRVVHSNPKALQHLMFTWVKAKTFACPVPVHTQLAMLEDSLKQTGSLIFLLVHYMLFIISNAACYSFCSFQEWQALPNFLLWLNRNQYSNKPHQTRQA